MQSHWDMGLWALRFITLTLMVMAPVTAAANSGVCKTPKGQRCVCAASNGKKCAHIAKAICLSGKSVETPAGQRLTAHENNVELFKQCRELGGMKELVSNQPLLDTFASAETK